MMKFIMCAVAFALFVAYRLYKNKKKKKPSTQDCTAEWKSFLAAARAKEKRGAELSNYLKN